MDKLYQSQQQYLRKREGEAKPDSIAKYFGRKVQQMVDHDYVRKQHERVARSGGRYGQALTYDGHTWLDCAYDFKSEYSVLVDAKRLRDEKLDTGGRPKFLCSVNPKLPRGV